MAKKTGNARQSIGTASGLRRFAWATFGLLLVALAVGGIDLMRTRDRALESGDALLQERARIADALRQADDARLHALLARIRIELRGAGSWSQLSPAEGPAADPAGARQRDTLLRRALEGTDDVRAIDLLVAGAKGLVSVRVEPEGHSTGSAADAADRDSQARTLWYSDAVQEAVAANGRRMTRGPIAVAEAGPDAAAFVQVMLALHDADDVVQGVLVATVDLAPLADRLGSLASPSTRLALISPDGRLLGSPGHPPTAPIAGLLGEGGTVPESEPVITPGEGVRSLIVPVRRAEEGPVELAYWLERDAPPGLGRAALFGPWIAVWTALGLLTVALFGWDRDRLALRTAPGATSAGSSARAAGRHAARGFAASAPLRDPTAREAIHAVGEDAEDGDAPVRMERFVLRDWLADVRGCLEREAATRGLTLDLRCERTLPREIQQDPLWLGGLLVSLGREALDATCASRVALEVSEGDADRLCFELDAGDTDLEAGPGMQVIAGRLGAVLEGRGRGRLSVIVPAQLA